jgi:hypothetical protein
MVPTWLEKKGEIENGVMIELPLSTRVEAEAWSRLAGMPLTEFIILAVVEKLVRLQEQLH